MLFRSIPLITYPIASANDYVQLGMLNTAYKFKAFIIIAYAPKLHECVAAVSLLSPNAHILISDSGAGIRIRASAELAEPLQVCLPVDDSVLASGLSGFEPLGHDAYILLAHLRGVDPTTSLVRRLNTVIENTSIPLLTRQPFDAFGERPGAGFYIRRIGP